MPPRSHIVSLYESKCVYFIEKGKEDQFVSCAGSFVRVLSLDAAEGIALLGADQAVVVANL